MKTRTLFALITLALAATFTSCEKIKGKGEPVTEARNTGSFHSIGLSMSATVYFSQGPGYSVQVKGQQNVLEQIQTVVEGDELVIKVKDHVFLSKYEPVTVYITAQDIWSLNVSGSGDIINEGTWTGGDMSMVISGSGNIKITNLICDNIHGTISGSGDIYCQSGIVTREDLKISGSGKIDMRSVQCNDVSTTTSGSGDTYINAEKNLDVTISGSGNIWYYGTPAINLNISGSGSIHRL